MPDRLTHSEAMQLAVELTCSYLGTSHSDSTNAEDMILDYYRQLRNVETRLEMKPATLVEGEDVDITEAVA